MKEKIKSVLWIIIGISLSLCVSGCGVSGSFVPIQNRAQKPAYAVIHDDLGRTVTLSAKPQRVIILTTSLLSFSAAVNGPIVGRTTVRSKQIHIPSQYIQATEVGPVYAVSMEKVLALQPDLIIIGAHSQEKLLPLCEQNQIPVIALKTKTRQEATRALQIMGQIYGCPQQAAMAQTVLDKKIQQVLNKMPNRTKTAAILHVTPGAVTVELSDSIAGDMARLLRVQNVTCPTGKAGITKEKVPYSMEALLAADPDVILFTAMGSPDKIDKRLRTDLKANPSWAHLRAVRTGQVYVLPEQYFLVSPGMDYDKALRYMAKLIYGEAFDATI